MLSRLCLFLWCFAFTGFGEDFDLLIRDGRIIDGTGAPWFRGDVGVTNGRITAVGSLGRATAKDRIEARGLVLAPGFIDVHSHGLRGLWQNPSAENEIRQGVTTIVEGPDGSSPLPLAPFFQKLSSSKVAINIGVLVGHGTVRRQVLQMDDRQPTSEELEQMKALVDQAMRDGAYGLSTGLFYVPGNFAKTQEVIELGRVAARYGGVHISHMRDEADLVMDSVAETIRIGEEGGLATQVTHHKIIGKKNWGRSVETLRLIHEARSRGVDVTIDAYPYTASSTGTAAMFPQWSLAGGPKALAERLEAPEQRAKIKAEIVRRIIEDRGAGDAKNIVMASCGFDPSLAGKTLAELTQAKGKAPTPENAAEVAMEIQIRGGCSAVYHAISEEDVERILKDPLTMVASDGEIPTFGKDVPHPRSYGTFARVLGRYVREKHTLGLEEAVRKMTSLPAQRIGLFDRGVIRPGMSADLVLFDPSVIADKADFLKPHQYAVGVDSVWVNGVATMRDGKMTGQLAGGVLRRGQ